MIADYNGWTDLPEAEREALDMLELSTPVLPQHRHRRREQLLPATGQGHRPQQSGVTPRGLAEDFPVLHARALSVRRSDAGLASVATPRAGAQEPEPVGVRLPARADDIELDADRRLLRTRSGRR